MKKYFDLTQIRLLPNERVVPSRSHCRTNTKFGKRSFRLPVIPSNMLCSISEDLAVKLAREDYFYIMHRFNHNNVDFVQRMNELNLSTSISVGEGDEHKKQLLEISNRGLSLDYVCIDVAHGHSQTVKDMAAFIKTLFPDVFIIGGNVCTPNGVEFLSDVCDAIKIDVGSGSACTTFDTTQFGSRGWNGTMLLECSTVTDKPIILDGGVKTKGNLIAAYALGADMIMVGGMFSGFIDSPGDVVINNNISYKEFFGSASEYTKGHKKFVEGKKYLQPLKNMNLLDYYNEIKEAFQSGISYAGGTDLSGLRKCEWIVLDK